MGEEKTKKKGYSFGLSKVIGLAMVTVLVGMVLVGYLALTVIGPDLQKLRIDIGNQGNTGNQNNNQNNNSNQNGNGKQGITGNQNNNGNPSNANPNNSQNANGNQVNTGNQNNNNQNGNANQNNSNDKNANGNQGLVNNYCSAPSNPTGSYEGTGQFNLAITLYGNLVSGTITANVNCAVEQNGSRIQLALTLMPTSAPQGLQPSISVGNSLTFDFAGTTSNSQYTANAYGSVCGPSGATFTFNFSLSGSISQSSLTLTMTSASDSQISLSTSQPITLLS
jgi:hypothetical protein